ncbi:MAG TPA: PEP-CTERM sorting domain-containing protein [Stellaceae bacterium]|nr:PEP-CTERM sorting domain-containing protein [Stellaceae bacterium]
MRGRKHILLAAIAVGSVAFLNAPIPVWADPITYTLSDVAATFPDGTVDLTGSLIYDLAGNTSPSIDITATGAIPPLSTSPDSFISINVCPPKGVCRGDYISQNGDGLKIGIATPFIGYTSISDPIVSISLYIQASNAFITTNDVMGDIVQAPEPSALALLGTALAGLFLVGFWANRRARTDLADSGVPT